MADVTFDDLIPKAGGDVSFDDLVPGGPNFDDLIPKKGKAELRAAPEPTLRERAARWLIGDEKPTAFWERFVKGAVGTTGTGPTNLSVADVFPPTGVIMAGQEGQRAMEAGKPLEASLHALGVIPAAGPVARTVAAPVINEVAAAAQRMGVQATRAVDSGAANVMKEAPTLLPNPVRRAAERELGQVADAANATINKAGGNYSPADASKRALDDWLLGRTEAQDAVAETSALRAAETPPAAGAPARTQETHEIVTPDQGMKIDARPEVVELSELQLAQGKYQPRDRARGEYAQEARERASRLDPLQLQPGRVSDSGAPIVLPDGTIISGNGRAMSIAEVYTNPALAPQAEAYRASLGQQAAGMKQPVLIMRSGEMAPDDAARFADLSNRGRIAAMSAPERAARDAEAMGQEGIALYQGGDFTAPQNADFLRAFTSKAVGQSERAAFSKDGELTQEGVNRMRASVLHGAYGDSQLLSRMLESTDDNIRNLTGALTDAAPGFLAMRADAKAGTMMADLDATPQVIDAVKMIADLRSRGVSPSTHFAQQDAFSQADPMVEAWVRAFYNEDLTRPISRQKMTDVLNAYSTEARKHSAGGLFEDATKTGDVLNVASRAKGAADDAAQPVVSDVAPAVGAGVRDGGQAAGGRQASEVGPAAPTGSARAQGDGSAAAAGDAGAGAARVLTPEQAAEAITRNLTEARKVSITKAVGLEPGAKPAQITERLTEMARSKLPSDVNGLVKARSVIGDETWRDVTNGILHNMGATKNGWDLTQFAAAYKAMTPTGKSTLFGGAGREGFQQALDDLAMLAERIPKLQKLTQSDLLPPILDRLLNSRASGIGWLLLHPFTGFKTAIPQAAAFAVGKFLSRPMQAKSFSRWAQAMNKVAEHNTPGNMALLRLATQQLADAAENEIEPSLKQGMPMDAPKGEPGPAPKRQAEMRAHNPSWRDRIASYLMGDERASPERSRAVELLMGSRGMGSTGVGAVDLFPPTSMALAGNEVNNANTVGGAMMAAIGVIPGSKGGKSLMDAVERAFKTSEARAAGKPRNEWQAAAGEIDRVVRAEGRAAERAAEAARTAALRNPKWDTDAGAARIKGGGGPSMSVGDGMDPRTTYMVNRSGLVQTLDEIPEAELGRWHPLYSTQAAVRRPPTSEELAASRAMWGNPQGSLWDKSWMPEEAPAGIKAAVRGASYKDVLVNTVKKMKAKGAKPEEIAEELPPLLAIMLRNGGV
jgi:hypothetical protein